MNVNVGEHVFSGKVLLNALNAIDEAVFLIKLDGTIVEVNDAILQVLQVTRGECVGRQLEYFIAHLDRQKFRECMQLVLSKETIRNEIKVMRKDRTTFLAQMNASLVRDESGKSHAIVGTIRDITHRVAVQERITKTTMELTALMKSSTEIIRTTDLHQRLKAIAQAIQGLGWRRVLITLTDENLETTDIVSSGLTPEEEEYLWENKQPGHVWRQRLGQTFDRFKLGEFYYLPWSDPFVRNHFKIGTVNSRIPKEEMVDWDPQDLLYAPLRLPEGHIVGRISIDDPLDGRRPTEESLAPLELFVHQAAVAIENAYLIRDLETTRNQVKEYADQLELKVEERTLELRESEERYRSVVDNIGIGVSLISPKMEILTLNDQMKKWFPDVNVSKKPICYRVFYKPPQDKVCSYCPICKTLKDSQVHEATTDGSTDSGRDYRIVSSPIKGKDGRIMAAIELVEDITERRRMEQQLLKSERLAAIGELATMVGHDLRNPLTGINGAAYYLKMKLGPKMDRKTVEMLQLIEKDIQYSNKIISDLLDFSRDIRLARAKTSIKYLVEETLAKMRIPRKVKIIDITKRDYKVFVDAGQMNRVFENILKNAIDAMPRGGQLEIKSEKVKNLLKISFCDTGVGISKENLSKLGSPLFTTKAQGVGMGLAICKRLTEAHGGSLSIQSGEETGTCVTVMLPMDIGEEKPEETVGGR